MKIITVPNPILTRKSKIITRFDSKLKNFCQNLTKTLSNAKNPSGIGLAAPQVGKNWRIFTIALPGEKPQIFINPKITHHSKKKKCFTIENGQLFLEGCLSIPEIYGAVKRWPKIKAVWQNEKGEKQQAAFGNIKAIVFQHEYDHLNGILFTQRVIKQGGQFYPPCPIIFFGSEENSVIILKKLISLSYIKITAVVTQPPQPKGRKQILTPTPVAQFARNHHLTILTPQKLDQKIINHIKNKKPQLGVLAAYGKIIPQKLIDIFPRGIINIHPSLLPTPLFSLNFEDLLRLRRLSSQARKKPVFP